VVVDVAPALFIQVQVKMLLQVLPDAVPVVNAVVVDDRQDLELRFPDASMWACQSGRS